MKLLGEQFEYLIQNIGSPSNKEMEKLEYDSQEYKKIEWHKEYYNLLLNELGAVGWELIAVSDNSFGGKTIDKMFFKRSSNSKYFKTGYGVDVIALRDLAKKQAEETHLGN